MVWALPLRPVLRRVVAPAFEFLTTLPRQLSLNKAPQLRQFLGTGEGDPGLWRAIYSFSRPSEENVSGSGGHADHGGQGPPLAIETPVSSSIAGFQSDPGRISSSPYASVSLIEKLGCWTRRSLRSLDVILISG